MIASPHNGKTIQYRDASKITHVGVVVGQSEDGEWLHIRSSNVGAPPADWHFRVRADAVRDQL